LKKVLESSFKKNKVNKALDKIPRLFHFSMMPGSFAGIPDKIICYRGRFIAWEIKRSKQDADKERQGHALQKWIIQKIADAGGLSRIVYPENFNECLAELLSLE
jgi:hypothetical protein